MKKLDRLVIGEMLGPWCFGVGIFTVLIMAGSMLFELTRYLSEGVSPATMAELTVLMLPGVMVKTFPMAVLLSALLSFGRLSGDSEIVALKAGGVSVGRIMAPVAGFGFAVFVLTFLFDETLVPGAALRATQLKVDINTMLEGKSDHPTFYPIYEQGRLTSLVTAADFNMAKQTLTNAYVVTLDKDKRPLFILWASEMRYTDEEDWRIKGGGQLLSFSNGVTVEWKGDLFPPQVPSPKMTPENLIAKALRDLDALSMNQMAEQIRQAKRMPKPDKSQIANLEFGYWNKLAVPLAALVFGLVGAPLGIRNHRAGTGTGFWLSVVVIFAYMLLANMMSIYAQGGLIPAYVASFAPIAVGVVVGGILIHRRNK